MKFALEHFNEIKAGSVLIYIDETNEFTKGADYEVKEDDEGLFVVDDADYDELLNRVLAQYFVIKEPDRDELEAQAAAMREALTEWQQWWKALNPETNPLGKGRIHEKGEQALSSTAGQDLLKRVERMEAVVQVVLERQELIEKGRTFEPFTWGSMTIIQELGQNGDRLELAIKAYREG